MAKSSTMDELAGVIEGLRTERAEHLAAIAALDELFERFGIETGDRPKRGRPRKYKKAGRPRLAKAGKGPVGRPKSKKTKKKKKAGRPRRSRFGQTAEELVLAFVKSNPRTSAGQVNSHWKKQERGGTANNALTKLTKAKKLKRVKVKGERGSRYVVA